MKKYNKRFYLLGFVIITIVTLAFYIQHVNTNQLLLQRVEDISYGRVQLLNREVSSWLESKAQTIAVVAASISLENLDQDDLLRLLQELLHKEKDFFSLYLGTPDNTMINASGWEPPLDFDLRERPWYRRANEAGDVIFTEAFINASQDDLIITIAQPVYSQRTGNFLGVVAGDISIKTILSVLNEMGEGEEGLSLLIDSQKNILSYPEDEFRLEEGLLELPKEYALLIDDLKANEKKIGKVDLHKTQGYLSYKQVKNTDWTLLTFTPLEEYTQIFSQLIRASLLAFLLSLTILLIFLWMQRQYVIHPLLFFQEGIEKIDLEGSLDYRLPERGGDFSFLTNSINKVLDMSQEYFNKLMEKEQELLMTNEKLSTAFDRISASEEEISAQYDEIYDYVERLEDLQQKYTIAIDTTDAAVWEFNLEERRAFISREFEKIAGLSYEKGEDIERIMDTLIMEEDQKDLLDHFKESVVRDYKIYIKLPIRDVHHAKKWILLSGRGVRDLKGEIKYMYGIILDITEMKRQEEYIEYLAYHDPLTQLPNRRSFMEVLENQLDAGQVGAVMLLDLDNFKTINDSLGHLYGDKVLKEVAQRLMTFESENLFLSRFGGDEFLILVKNEDSIEKIEDICEAIVDLFHRPLQIEESEIHIRFSMGITLFPDDSSTIYRLLTNADIAMYQVKSSGKNNYAFFKREMTDQLVEKKEIEGILRRALLTDGFHLEYQPQVDIETGWVQSLEALIRLKDHALSPAKFIPVAEETGLIIDIGKWVVHEVISQIASWKEKGLKGKRVAINFSVVQLNDEGFLSHLQETLSAFNVEPEYLEIEITESFLLERTDDTIAFLNELKAMGLHLALDDFGTNYSSLSYLTFVPVDKVKLDKSLNDRFLKMESIEVMDSLIALIHSLDLVVTAEGIEEVEQYKRLKVGKCNFIQGFIFSRPLDVLGVEEIYHKNFSALLREEGLLKKRSSL